MAFSTGVLKLIQFVRILHHPTVCRSFLIETTKKNVQSFIIFNTVHNKHTVSTEREPKSPSQQTNPNAPEKPKHHKPPTSPSILLISSEENIESTTLENAEKLANRRNLKLVKIVDFNVKSQKPIYKLMTAQQYFEEDSLTKTRRKQDKDSGKAEKFFNIHGKICEHDLDFKIVQIMKSLKKNHNIRINISSDGNSQKSEEIAKKICEAVKDVSIQKNSVKTSKLIKLHFVPKPESKENISNDKDDKDSQKSSKLDDVEIKATVKE